jgi:NAD(P)-dependent dehydrogenase (short-subunit alcohol dehydrogenase family)
VQPDRFCVSFQKRNDFTTSPDTSEPDGLVCRTSARAHLVMSFDGTGRVVIITGGAGAVGSTVSRRWLEAGASVLVVDHRQATIDAWLAEYFEERWAKRIATLATDVTTESGAAVMVEKALASFAAEPDTLIHLVGGFAMAAVEDENAPRIWDNMMAINATSAFRCYRAMLPALRARKGGWIVGLTSRAADAPGARISAYAASKAALGALTSSLSAEVRGAGIHVNLIVASTIDTPANRKDMGEAKAATWVSPDDIADATMYLCSERARSVHGATLEVFANA